MKGTFKVDEPEYIEYTATITMTLADWRKLLDQMEGVNYPTWGLKSMVYAMIKKAEKTIYEEGEL